ncbi:MAG: hypothetical protein Q4B82_05115, partial [Alysiella sp.]|uniref:hypothetical protein n=1 Tax=Alysiella sp. TaxID=1872483 RepID=UPI0026DD757C
QFKNMTHEMANNVVFKEIKKQRRMNAIPNNQSWYKYLIQAQVCSSKFNQASMVATTKSYDSIKHKLLNIMTLMS